VNGPRRLRWVGHVAPYEKVHRTVGQDTFLKTWAQVGGVIIKLIVGKQTVRM